MKTLLVIILLIVVLAGAGYFGLPFLIDKETATLKTDIQDLKQKIQKIEEESKAAPLPPDADVQKIIKTVNAVSQKVSSLEDTVKKDLSAADEQIKNQKATTEESFKKQAETIDKINKDMEVKMRKNMFNTLLASIRGHVLKVKVDLVARNIGTAKTELDIISEALEKAKTSATDENKEIIEELQKILKKARAEVDADLPAAINRIDLLWYEMNKLLRKS